MQEAQNRPLLHILFDILGITNCPPSFNIPSFKRSVGHFPQIFDRLCIDRFSFMYGL